MEAVLTALVGAAIAGTFGFAMQQIKNARDDVSFYRSTLLPALEKMVEIVASLQSEIVSLKGIITSMEKELSDLEDGEDPSK